MTLPNKGYDENLTYFEHNIDDPDIPNVFIHGVGLDSSMWSPQKKFFNKKQILFYDLLNHGNSKKKYKKLSFKKFNNQINTLLDFLQIKKCNIIGFSIGALIAQHYAVENYKKLNKLILIGSVYKRNVKQINIVKKRYTSAKNGIDISNDAIKRWFNIEYLNKNIKIKKHFIKILKKNKKDNFLPAYKVFVNADKCKLNLNKINVDTLIMTGENEVGSTPEMNVRLHKQIKNSKLFIIPKAKHMVSFEFSKIVNKRICEFIDK